MIYGVWSGRVGAHTPAQTFREHSPALYASYFVFATVRHPFERLQSTFYYLKAGGRHEGDRRWAAENISQFDTFRQFVLALENDATRERVMRYVHFKPQTHFVCDADGKLMVETLVRTEEFETGMREVCRTLNIDFINQRINVTAPYAGRNEELTPDLEQICRALYPQDYDILQYRPLR